MFRILIKKCINEAIVLWVACALTLFLFPWIRIWTVSQFELSGFAPLLKQFRAFEKFSPVPLDQFLTYHGMIGFTFDEPVLVLCILVWSIARGSDVISGELGRGTMEMLLAQPVSRSKVFAAHALVTVTGLVLLCMLVYAGIYLGIHTNTTPATQASLLKIPLLNWEWSGTSNTVQMVPLAQLVSAQTFIVPSINLFALGFAVLGLSVMFSAWDQYRWRTIGLVIGIYVLQLLLFVLSKSTPKLAGLKTFSFVAAYQPDWIVQSVHRSPETAWQWWLEASGSSTDLSQRIGPLGYVTILITMGMVCFAVGYVRFKQRDLPAPQ